MTIIYSVVFVFVATFLCQDKLKTTLYKAAFLNRLGRGGIWVEKSWFKEQKFSHCLIQFQSENWLLFQCQNKECLSGSRDVIMCLPNWQFCSCSSVTLHRSFSGSDVQKLLYEISNKWSENKTYQLFHKNGKLRKYGNFFPTQATLFNNLIL